MDHKDLRFDELWSQDLTIRSTGSIALDADAKTQEIGVQDIDIPPPRRRGFERHALDRCKIIATIESREGAQREGRVLESSVTGFWVQTSSPLPFRASVEVEWRVMGGYAMTFMGRVVRSTEAGMAIHLKCDDSSWRFRSSFIDIARTPSAMPPSMVVRCVSDGGEDNDYRALHEAWQKARISLSDADHQAFITEMLKRKRLDYALEQYRRLQEEEPQSEIAARYLKQIGTILGFYTLQRAPEVSASSDNILKRSIFLIMVGAVCLALGGWLIQTKLTTPAPSIAGEQLSP